MSSSYDALQMRQDLMKSLRSEFASQANRDKQNMELSKQTIAFLKTLTANNQAGGNMSLTSDFRDFIDLEDHFVRITERWQRSELEVLQKILDILKANSIKTGGNSGSGLGLLGGLGDILLDGVKGIGSKIKNLLKDAESKVEKETGKVKKAVVDEFEDLKTKATSEVKSLSKSVSNEFKSLSKEATDELGKIKNFAKTLFDDGKSAAKNVVSDAGKVVKSVESGAGKAGKGLLSLLEKGGGDVAHLAAGLGFGAIGAIGGAIGDKAAKSANKLKSQGVSALNPARLGNTTLSVGGEAAAGAALGTLADPLTFGLGTPLGALLGGAYGYYNANTAKSSLIQKTAFTTGNSETKPINLDTLYVNHLVLLNNTNSIGFANNTNSTGFANNTNSTGFANNTNSTGFANNATSTFTPPSTNNGITLAAYNVGSSTNSDNTDASSLSQTTGGISTNNATAAMPAASLGLNAKDTISAISQASNGNLDLANTLSKFAGAESNYNPNSGNNTSSAKGAFQITQGTAYGSPGQNNGWIQKYGGKFGITTENYNPNNPTQQAQLVSAWIEDTKNKDQANGISATTGNLYSQYFLGNDSLVRDAQTMPNASAAKLFPDAAAANKSIFYNSDGSSKTVAQVQQYLTSKVNSRDDFATAYVQAEQLQKYNKSMAVTNNSSAAPSNMQTSTNNNGPSVVPTRYVGGGATSLYPTIDHIPCGIMDPSLRYCNSSTPTIS